ncbi:MAG: cupin domain-containing protein [Alphaproteobacteria bacterium]|nr:cupin domain-containing protein [Alphaproteobacteria bacterium]
MTHEHDDGLAAEYVLGTLDGDARRRFAEALARDPKLRARVADWERRLNGLGQGAAAVEPSAGLWANIDGALDALATERPSSVTIHAGEGAWEQLAEGIEKKTLYFDEMARSESYLLRVAPGAQLPSHKHRATEECIVLEGSFDIGDIHLKPGDFHVMEADTRHPVIYSAQGGVAYIRGELR